MNSNKRDIFWRGEIHQQCEGDTPSLPFFGDRDSDQQTIDRWNGYLKTATAIYPVSGSHSWKDGEDVTGRYKLQYQEKMYGEFHNCTLDEYNKLEPIPDCRRIVAVALPYPTAETVGSIISDAIKLHELNPDVVDRGLELFGNLDKLMKDEIYVNCIPVVLFKNLLLSLHIPFSRIEPAILPTFKLMQSKETPATIKKKPQGYMLWENEESILKYTNQLKELMTTPSPSQEAEAMAKAKELYDFLTGKQKPFYVDQVRKLLQKYDKEEISFSKFVEELNITAYHWEKSRLNRL